MAREEWKILTISEAFNGTIAEKWLGLPVVSMARQKGFWPPTKLFMITQEVDAKASSPEERIFTEVTNT